MGKEADCSFTSNDQLLISLQNSRIPENYTFDIEFPVCTCQIRGFHYRSCGDFFPQ
jgi:hypothetical protein